MEGDKRDKRLGRPPKPVDMAFLTAGKVDTYSRLSDLKGEDRERRQMWERLRRQRQKDARLLNRENPKNLQPGEDGLLRLKDDKIAALQRQLDEATARVGQLNVANIMAQAELARRRG